MPGVKSGSGALADDQMVIEALESFCSSSEQTYDQFLASFTHLTPGGVGSGHTTVPSGPNPLLGEMERSVESRDRRNPEAEGQLSVCVLPADQEEMVLDAGVTVGICNRGDFHPPGRTLKLDNYLDVGDFSQEEEANVTAGPDGGVLPGEVEEDLPAYLPSFCHLTQLELTSTAGVKRLTSTAKTQGTQGRHASPEQHSEIEEVLPFSLDENFDYDHVMLSSKHPIPKTCTGPP